MSIPNNANTFLPPTPVVPGFLLITDVTTTNPMVVTIVDSDENTYVPGQLVHFCIPPPYKMVQLDQLSGQILAIEGDDFVIEIDATTFNPFVTPSNFQQQPASLAPAGSRNLEINNNTSRVVPFHSLNNRGN